MESLHLRADGSEVLVYNAPDFPISTDYNCLSIFADYAANCHWHQDFEALIALDGEMDYQVNGQRVHLYRGDGIFVNSGRLHFGYSAEMRECNYCFAVFHTSLLGLNPAAASALERLASDRSPDYWLFSAAAEQDRKALDFIRFLCDHAAPEEALAVLSAGAGLLYEILLRSDGHTDRPADPDWTILRQMVGYIQSHYQERILLEDIAAAGAVCRSKCCALFRNKLRVSPLNYVIRYRLEKACDLMREGKSVTEAAFSTGFQGLSYFSEAFKKAFGMKPSQYVQSCAKDRK